MLKGSKALAPRSPSMPVQLTLPRKDTSCTLRCDDGVLLPWRFRWEDRFFLRRPVRGHSSAQESYIHVDYGALEKDGAVLCVSRCVPKVQSCTLNCTLGELAVLRLIADNPRITQKGLAAVIGISERTVKTRTVELQAKGLLQREGGRRNGEWVIPSAIRGEIDAAR